MPVVAHQTRTGDCVVAPANSSLHSGVPVHECFPWDNVQVGVGWSTFVLLVRLVRVAHAELRLMTSLFLILSISRSLSLSRSLPLLQHTLSPSRSLALLLSCSVFVSLILVYVQSYAESTRGVMTTRKHKRCLPANAPHSNQATVPLIHRRYSTTAVRVLTTLACRSCQGENRQVTTMLTTTLASLAER